GVRPRSHLSLCRDARHAARHGYRLPDRRRAVHRARLCAGQDRQTPRTRDTGGGHAMTTRFFRLGLLGAFLLQTALVAWLIVDRALLIKNGREVRLAVVPVDPRDLLRGDYVILSYPISRLQTDEVEG